MFGSLGAPELIIIGLIVVLLFGVGKISGLGREVGSSIKEFRKAVKDEDAEKETAQVAAPPQQQYVQAQQPPQYAPAPPQQYAQPQPPQYAPAPQYAPPPQQYAPAPQPQYAPAPQYAPPSQQYAPAPQPPAAPPPPPTQQGGSIF
jgi:TatA/E family protein of Tat protein translocase